MVSAKELLTQEVTTVPQDEPISKILSKLKKTDVIIVEDNGNFKGVILQRDVMRAKIPQSAKAKTYLRHPPTINLDETDEEIARLMLENNIYHIPVVENDKVKGVVKAEQLLKHTIKKEIGAVPVVNFMTSPVTAVSPDENVSKAIKMLRRHRISRLPVVENEEIVGVVTIDDIIGKILHQEDKPEGWAGHGEYIDEKKKYLKIPVSGIMSEKVITMSPETSISEVIDEMYKLHYMSVLIEEKGMLAGIVTRKDLLEPVAAARRPEPITVQFAGDLDVIEGFTKPSARDYIQERFERYKDFLELENGFIVAHLKQHKEQRRGTHLIYCKLRVASPQGMFIASDEGWGYMHAIKKASTAVEKQIEEQKPR